MIPLWTTQPFRSVSERAELEDAAMLRLAPLRVDHGGYLKALDLYNGDLDEQDAPEDFYQQLLGRSPAILVCTGTGRFESRSTRGEDYEEFVALELLVISSSWRSLVARSRGDVTSIDVATYDPGVYHILAAARRLLAGRPLGIDMATILRPSSDTPIVQSQKMTAWRSTYMVKMHVDQRAEEVDAIELDALTLRGIYVSSTDPERYTRILDAEIEPS